MTTPPKSSQKFEFKFFKSLHGCTELSLDHSSKHELNREKKKSSQLKAIKRRFTLTEKGTFHWQFPHWNIYEIHPPRRLSLRRIQTRDRRRIRRLHQTLGSIQGIQDQSQHLLTTTKSNRTKSHHIRQTS